MKIQYLGGASEVGRSCIAIHIKNDTTLLDCGIKVKGTTIDEKYPYIENIINKNNIRRRIITHAHMDHCGALPYFLNHYC
jgi:predicted metal-dependent RNase